MSAESSWTLLKVIWQSCPDRFPNEIDPSIHTTPTFVEQPFRISFSPFLSLPPIRSRPPSTRCSIRRSLGSASAPTIHQAFQFPSKGEPPRGDLFARVWPRLVIHSLQLHNFPQNDSSWSLVRFRKFRGRSTFRNFSRKFYRGQERFLGDKLLPGNFGEFLNLLRNFQAHSVLKARCKTILFPIFNQVKSVSLVSPFVYFILFPSFFLSFFLLIARGRSLILIRSQKLRFIYYVFLFYSLWIFI